MIFLLAIGCDFYNWVLLIKLIILRALWNMVSNRCQVAVWWCHNFAAFSCKNGWERIVSAWICRHFHLKSADILEVHPQNLKHHIHICSLNITNRARFQSHTHITSRKSCMSAWINSKLLLDFSSANRKSSTMPISCNSWLRESMSSSTISITLNSASTSEGDMLLICTTKLESVHHFQKKNSVPMHNGV